MRKYVVPIFFAPAAAVALYYAAWAISTPNTTSEWLVLLGFVPLVAALAWTILRTRSVSQTVLIGVAMLLSTFVLWWLALLVILVVAGVNCPEDGYECPI